jgi:hypothetical protein
MEVHRDFIFKSAELEFIVVPCGTFVGLHAAMDPLDITKKPCSESGIIS